MADQSADRGLPFKPARPLTDQAEPPLPGDLILAARPSYLLDAENENVVTTENKEVAQLFAVAFATRSLIDKRVGI